MRALARERDRAERRGQDDLLQPAHGVYTPTGGRIRFDGHDLTGMPPHEIAKLGIARTFQNIRLFAQMTALENVLVGQHARHQAGVLGALFRRRAVPARSARRAPGARLCVSSPPPPR